MPKFYRYSSGTIYAHFKEDNTGWALLEPELEVRWRWDTYWGGCMPATLKPVSTLYARLRRADKWLVRPV